MKYLIIALTIMLAACSESATGPDLPDIDAIQHAFFSEIIQAALPNEAAAFCLSTGPTTVRVDPSAEVVALVRALGNAVPASQCVFTATNVTFNGSSARSYHIDSITVDGGTATVLGHFTQDGVLARYRARVELQLGHWVITSLTPV